ncbi:unnamed protein product, partial [Ectocarpus sp. 4 AP-2014]
LGLPPLEVRKLRHRGLAPHLAPLGPSRIAPRSVPGWKGLPNTSLRSPRVPQVRSRRGPPCLWKFTTLTDGTSEHIA